MPTFTITGGTPLYGSVRVGGAKNASFKLMIAALLADSPSRLLNFSHISDVFMVAEVIEYLGGKAQQVGERSYAIEPSTNLKDTIPAEYGARSRASTLFIPVLLAKTGRAVVPQPGGDKLGPRPLDRHFEGLEAMGATVTRVGEQIEVTASQLTGTHYRFAKNSHTGTETLLMAAVLAKGTTVLDNAAEETEVDDLIEFLNSMGADVARTAPRQITIQGVTQLHGAIHKIMPDHNQVVSFACAALATKGDVIVENAKPSDLTAFLSALDQVKAGYEVGDFGVRFYYQQELVASDIVTDIHPGFKTDWQPVWVTMMTQAKGVSTVHETIHPYRFQYVESLRQMGAHIAEFSPEVTDPEAVYNFNISDENLAFSHAVRITGPTALHGGEFKVLDLRHGATLMIAGLTAQGQTILHDADSHIDRGYEQLDTQLCSMGARIERQET